MRILLYTGKGGVGKTSIAAATALKLANMGKRVLIISTDQAHSLSDSFGQKLGDTPRVLKDTAGKIDTSFKVPPTTVTTDKTDTSDTAGSLSAMEINAVTESEKAWGNLKDYLKTLLTSQSGESIEVEELLVFPGFEELFSLFKIMDIYRENQYDVLIVDCAPTGETMSLLKFPEMLEGWIKKFLPLERKMLKTVGPLVEKTMKIPMPEENIFDEIEALYQKIDRLQQLLKQKDTVSIRIVTTPEKIVIREAKRNFTCLQLFDYNVDGVIINKIYPGEALPGYFHQWLAHQEAGIQDIQNSFAGIPVFRLELQKQELHTPERLTAAAELLYGETDPSAVLCHETIFSLLESESKSESEPESKTDGICHFEIKLPLLEKKDMDLFQKGDELFINIGNQYRSIVLPPRLRGKSVTGAKYAEGRLRISFAND